MKKKAALLLTVALTVTAALVGCGKSEDRVAQKPEEQKEETVKTEGALKTGLALMTSVENSAEPGEKDGAAQADISIAAVTVDADGKIVSCTIDAVQSVVNFNAEGKLTTDLSAEIPSKQELGDDYGMRKASSIQKEWNEQADAFAEYCIGKTVEEINGIALTDKGAAADLASSCTVYAGGFQAIVTKAAENAVEGGAQAGDKLGLGIVTNIAKSAEAGEKEGLAQTYTTVTAVTVGADGKITSAVIDAVQANVNFDAAGKITTDLTAACPSKNELGEDYGMKDASSIGKEWNEQAAAYAAYAVGKTADEVNGTAVEEGVPTDADLASSVTLHIGDFNTVITKAVNNAK